MGEDTRAIEGQIEDTRERMGDTVAALSYEADLTRVFTFMMARELSMKTYPEIGNT